MAKCELNVLFKKMQRDDKKDVLKFEYKSKDKDSTIRVPQQIYDMAGELVNIEIENSECGPVTAELSKVNKDSKKVVLELSLRGDCAEKAADIFLLAGTNVNLTIEPCQTSLEDFNNDADDDPHKGIEYEVDLTGSVSVKSKYDDDVLQ